MITDNIMIKHAGMREAICEHLQSAHDELEFVAYYYGLIALEQPQDHGVYSDQERNDLGKEAARLDVIVQFLSKIIEGHHTDDELDKDFRAILADCDFLNEEAP